jgi:hypothetical protein
VSGGGRRLCAAPHPLGRAQAGGRRFESGRPAVLSGLSFVDVHWPGRLTARRYGLPGAMLAQGTERRLAGRLRRGPVPGPGRVGGAAAGAEAWAEAGLARRPRRCPGRMSARRPPNNASTQLARAAFDAVRSAATNVGLTAEGAAEHPGVKTTLDDLIGQRVCAGEEPQLGAPGQGDPAS